MNEPGGDPGEEVGPVLVVVEDRLFVLVEFFLVELRARPGDGEFLQYLLREDRIPGEQIAIEEVLLSFVDDKFDLEAVFSGRISMELGSIWTSI